jgi:hypothetical protein
MTPTDAPVLAQRMLVRVDTQFVQKLRGVLAIGEEERDRAGWKLARHGRMIRDRGSKNGSDGTRTGDLRRDRPVMALPG